MDTPSHDDASAEAKLDAESTSSEDEGLRPRARYEGIEPAPASLGPGPDGLPMPPSGVTPAMPPEQSIENMLCRRGPCRHFMRFITDRPANNPEGAFEEVPKEATLYCLRTVGDVIQLEDAVVYDCDQWDPIDTLRDADWLGRERRRAEYLAAHPEFVKRTTTFAEDVGDVVDDYEPAPEPVGEARTALEDVIAHSAYPTSPLPSPAPEKKE